jgi:electron transport complex protein RnfE
MNQAPSSWQEAAAPLWRDNLAFAQLLGLCPLLAVTTTLVTGLALGVASAAVIVVSSTTMAALRRFLAPRARLPLALVLLATLVTVIDLTTAAMLFDLHGVLGLFVPLIVVNSGLLAHAGNVASERSIGFTFLSALSTGVGFIFAFILLGTLREVVGHGTLLAGIEMLAGGADRELTLTLPFSGMLVAVLPPGAFFAMGLLLALRNRFTAPATEREAS